MKILSNKEYKKLKEARDNVPKRDVDKLIKAMELIERLGCYIVLQKRRCEKSI